MDERSELARALEEARGRAGLSYAAVVGELRDRLGPYALSTVEGVRNYHRPDSFPARPDLVQLAALADIYGERIEDIAPEAAVVLVRIRDSLGRGACLGTPV